MALNNATLMAVFDTELLQKIFTITANEVSEPRIAFVGLRIFSKASMPSMIFNTHYEDEIDEHWVAVYIDGKMQSAYIFDSLPVRPFPQNIFKKLAIKSTILILSSTYMYYNGLIFHCVGPTV